MLYIHDKTHFARAQHSLNVWFIVLTVETRCYLDVFRGWLCSGLQIQFVQSMVKLLLVPQLCVNLTILTQQAVTLSCVFLKPMPQLNRPLYCHDQWIHKSCHTCHHLFQTVHCSFPKSQLTGKKTVYEMLQYSRKMPFSASWSSQIGAREWQDQSQNSCRLIFCWSTIRLIIADLELIHWDV